MMMMMMMMMMMQFFVYLRTELKSQLPITDSARIQHNSRNKTTQEKTNEAIKTTKYGSCKPFYIQT
jgi:hypothetical protein